MSLMLGWLFVAAATVNTIEPLAAEVVLAVNGFEATDRRTCVAARVAPTWWLTASHCVPEPSTHVRAACAGRNLTIRSTVRHPTHDVVIIETTIPPRDCATTILPIASTNNDGGRLWAPVLPGRQLVEVRTVGGDEHILRLRPKAGCWTRGDSGTPVLGADGIVAILLSGPSGCTGTQTAVRLDRLHPWLTRHVQH